MLFRSTYLPAAGLARLVAGLPADVLLVLDGAYADFVDAADFDWGAKYVDSHPNVVVTRTFSKLYGLAGLRIGWLYAPVDVVDAVERIRTPFNASSAAMAAATAAVCEYAVPYTAVLEQGNVCGVQFHPEKSGDLGLKIVRNFVES